MDEADRGQAREEWFRGLALAAHRQRLLAVPPADAPPHCADCGERIPQARREAVPGCTRCVDCQTDHDLGRSR